jgi:hypothetical protein
MGTACGRSPCAFRPRGAAVSPGRRIASRHSEASGLGGESERPTESYGGGARQSSARVRPGPECELIYRTRWFLMTGLGSGVGARRSRGNGTRRRRSGAVHGADQRALPVSSSSLRRPGGVLRADGRAGGARRSGSGRGREALPNEIDRPPVHPAPCQSVTHRTGPVRSVRRVPIQPLADTRQARVFVFRGLVLRAAGGADAGGGRAPARRRTRAS